MALFLAALMLLAQTAGQSGQAAKAAIEGVVHHTATNAPIAGARVTLMRFIRVSNEFGGAEPASSAVTDAQGRFRFPDLPEGAYALQVDLDGYIFLTETYAINVTAATLRSRSVARLNPPSAPDPKSRNQ